MKKVMLLLGALSLVSSVAYAKEVLPAVEEVVVVEEVKTTAPTLTVTSIGQALEFDNDSGSSDIGESVFFRNYVNLAYGEDWTFNLMAAKIWDMDTDEGIDSDNHRLELGFWRNFDNFSIGARWRGQSDYDRLYLQGKYSYGMFSGNLDIAYQASNDDSDSRDGWYVEGEPLQVTVGPLTFGYYIKSQGNYLTGTETAGDINYWFKHQLRVAFPLYKGEKLDLGFQYGWEFANSMDVEGDYYAYKHDSNTHVLWLNASYAVSENLTISGYYEYDMYEWEKEGNGTLSDDSPRSNDDESYYGEFFIGWTYTF